MELFFRQKIFTWTSLAKLGGFLGQILISEALNIISTVWQSSNSLTEIHFISNSVRSAAAVTDISIQEHRTCVLPRSDYLKCAPLSNVPRFCWGILVCLLSCIGQLFIQIIIVIITSYALLLFACLITSGGSGICCKSL